MNMQTTRSLFTLLPPYYDRPQFEDIKVYLKRIEKDFGIKIKKYKYLIEAFANDVFVINDELIFRFPRTQYNRNHLKYEIDFLDYLQDKVAIQIPKYSLIARDLSFAGYQLIPGKYLTNSTFKSLSNVNKKGVIEEIITFINTFHNLDKNDFEKYKPTKREQYVSIEKQIEVDLEKRLFPKLSKNDVDLIKQFYEEANEVLKTAKKDCPIHGDLYAYNVLWNKETQKLGIIDFSDYMSSDPARDFEIFFDFGVQYAESAYQKYQGVKDANFLKRAEIYYKAHGIYTLLSSVLDAKISFDYAYKYFFKIKFSSY